MATIAQFVQFLGRWQHATPGTQLEGRGGLLEVIEQLAGFEIAAGEWESEIFPARVLGYQPHWLDELCLSGEVAWGRLTPRPEATDASTLHRRGASTPSRATPLAFMRREGVSWLLDSVRLGAHAPEPLNGSSAEILTILRERGACFRSELPALAQRLPGEVDEGLWDLVARGLVTADAFSAVRSLLTPWRSHGALSTRVQGRYRATARRRGPAGSGIGEGRWALLPVSGSAGLDSQDDLAEAVAWQMLIRWGVMAWELWSQEAFGVPWRGIVRALRRFEARGLALGGRFIAGLSGEQYGLPDAVEMLGRVRRDQHGDDELEVVASDPLNLTGTVLGGRRIPAVRNRRVAYRGGILVEEHVSSAS